MQNKTKTSFHCISWSLRVIYWTPRHKNVLHLLRKTVPNELKLKSVCSQMLSQVAIQTQYEFMRRWPTGTSLLLLTISTVTCEVETDWPASVQRRCSSSQWNAFRTRGSCPRRKHWGHIYNRLLMGPISEEPTGFTKT